MKLPLFEAATVEPSDSRQPSTDSHQPATVNQQPAFSYGPEVLRVVESAGGTFTRLRGGVVVDEFRILEMMNGHVFEETIGGVRTRSHVTCDLIASSLEWRQWRVVWP